jgi:PAS domain S-box-containing protein
VISFALVQLTGEADCLYDFLPGKFGEASPPKNNSQCSDLVPRHLRQRRRTKVAKRKPAVEIIPRRAKKAPRTSERTYRLLFERNPQPMWVYDLRSLAFLAVNEAASEQYGYSRDEFLRMTIRDVRPAQDVSRLLESASHGGAGLEQSGTWRHRKKDGTLLDVQITSHNLEWAGRPARLVLAVDIT